MAKASRVAAKTASSISGIEERLTRIEAALRILLTLAGKPEESIKVGLPSEPSSKALITRSPVKSSSEKKVK